MLVYFVIILFTWCIRCTSTKNMLLTASVPLRRISSGKPLVEHPRKIYSVRKHWPKFKFPRFNGKKLKCGMDTASDDSVRVGMDSVETYPWIGRLFYPIDDMKLTTVVVSITKDLVIGSAFEIDKFPKTDFRAKARVVLGSNCDSHQYSILDYVYHPEYKNHTQSSLALIQLDLENVAIELHPHPICSVPAKKISSAVSTGFYAFILPKSKLNTKILAIRSESEMYGICGKPMSSSGLTKADGCKDTRVRVYKMDYVDPKECRSFYKRSGLDLQDLWPTHTVCARAGVADRPCVWRSGAVLALRDKDRWRMAGLGVYGPGCSTPSRFLHYGMHRVWVWKNILRMGKTAVTRVADNHLIMRQKTSQLQRFGPCDPEEKNYQVFTEDMDIFASYEFFYNLTLFTTVDYNCIIILAENVIQDVDYPPPKIKLKRWCVSSGTSSCASSQGQLQKMDFAVQIYFLGKVHLKVNAYGGPSRRVDRKTYVKYMNGLKHYPDINWAQAPLFPDLNLTSPFGYMKYIRPG